MASTFSQTLRLELIGDGDQSGIWGQTTNTNLGTLLEQAITGVVSITMTDTNYTLSNFNGVSDEARNAVLVVGGTNAAVRDIIAPLVEKLYVVRNSTGGGFAVNIRGSSGSSVSIPSGATVWVYCDGINFNAINTESVGNFEVNGNLTVTGNTNAANATYTGNVAALNFSGGGLTLTSINASNISAGTIVNARTTAASANGASTIVARDTNGDFSARTITANLTGTATTATTANALNAGNSYTVNGLTTGGLVVGQFPVFFGTSGGGGDVQVLINGGSAIGVIAAVNLANNAYRWLKVGEGSPVLIGATGQNGSASLTLGTQNGNGSIFACSALNSGETGWGMVNSDACFGAFFFPNLGTYFVTNLLGSQIGISFFFSDIRSKQDITPTQEEILPLIDQIEFIDYRNKSRKENEPAQRLQTGGVSAQQLQTIKPEWVDELPDGGLMLNAPLMLANAYKAIQELSSKVAKLEEKIASLEAK